MTSADGRVSSAQSFSLSATQDGAELLTANIHVSLLYVISVISVISVLLMFCQLLFVFLLFVSLHRRDTICEKSFTQALCDLQSSRRPSCLNAVFFFCIFVGSVGQVT